MRVRWSGVTCGAIAMFLLTAPISAAQISARETKLIGLQAGADALFGISVAVSGDRVAVGAKDDGAAGVLTGATYVYRRSGSTWVEDGALRAPAPQPNDQFGFCVALDGTTCVCASPADSNNLGAAYVFTRGSQGWSFVTRLAAPAPSQTDSFGFSAAIDGNAIVVGAPGEGGVAAAHVYRRDTSGWHHEATLQANDSGPTDAFAQTVAIEGDTVVVGASLNDGAAQDTGAAYVFRKGASGWTQVQKLTPAAGGATGQFGDQVAISNGTIAIGVPGARVNDREVGGVAVFSPSGGTWAQSTTLYPPGGTDGDVFYRTLAIDGEALVVGAFTPDLLGAVCVFERRDGNWQNTGTLHASDAQSQGLFGRQVAIRNGTVLAGAVYSSHDAVKSGVAYAFDGVGPGTTVRGYLLPDRVRLVQVGRSGGQRLLVAGTIDTGPTPVDLTAPGQVRVGGLTWQLPGLARAPRGRDLVYDAGDLTLRITPSAAGTSRAAFSLVARSDAGLGIGPDDRLEVAYETAELSASATTQLASGRFTRPSRAAAWSAPPMALDGVRAVLGVADRDRVRLAVALPPDVAAVASASDVAISVGETFSVVVPGSAFHVRRSRQTFHGNVGGVTFVAYDHATGRVEVTATNVELGEFADGGCPLQVRVTTDAGTRACEVRAVRLGRALRY